MRKRVIITIFLIIHLLRVAQCQVLGCASSEHENNKSMVVDIIESNNIPPYEPRFNRIRPVIAVIGENSFTELTDFVVPFGILSEARVADVFALSTKAGPIQMFPSLKLQVEHTIAEFDKRLPEGADYIIVPAVHNSSDPVLLEWVSGQSKKGATIVGVCDGVWVLAKAGLLDGQKAVGHWYSVGKLKKKYPGTDWIENRRYIASGKTITTTGVSASIPVSLALVEAISGHSHASHVAEVIGVDDWSPIHHSSEFKLSRSNIFTAAKNWVSFWSHEKFGLVVNEGDDEIAIALIADAYSRTFRSKVFSISDKVIHTKHGLMLLPDKNMNYSTRFNHMLDPIDTNFPGKILSNILQNIENTYGFGTAAFVALQLEYSY